MSVLRHKYRCSISVLRAVSSTDTEALKLIHCGRSIRPTCRSAVSISRVVDFDSSPRGPAAVRVNRISHSRSIADAAARCQCHQWLDGATEHAFIVLSVGLEVVFNGLGCSDSRSRMCKLSVLSHRMCILSHLHYCSLYKRSIILSASNSSTVF